MSSFNNIGAEGGLEVSAVLISLTALTALKLR